MLLHKLTLPRQKKEVHSLRNKAKGFPNRMRFSKERRTDDEHQSKRANGEINDHPNARMNSSNNQQ